MKRFQLSLLTLFSLSLAGLSISRGQTTTITNQTTTETYTTANHSSKNLGAIGLNGTGVLDLVSTSSSNVSDTATSYSASGVGAETIDISNSGSGTFSFNLGNVGRSAGGTFNFVESTTGGAVSLISNSAIGHGTGAGTSNVAGNDLTFWAFYNGNDWAAATAGGAIVAATALYNDGGHDTTATNLSTWNNSYEDYVDDTTTAYSGTMTQSTQKRGLRFANSAGANLNLGGISNTLTIAGLLDAQGAGAVTIGSGTMTVNGLTTDMVINQNNLANNMTITASITGSGNPFSKVGVGTLILNATGSYSDTYTGQTYVSQGTLQNDGTINGTSSVLVEQGATLAGTGKITTPGTVTINGSLAPGDVTGTPTPGTLTFALTSGFKLNFVAGSTLDFDINGASSDSVAFSTLGNWLSGSGTATLDLDATNVLLNHPYVIFSKDNTSGFTFSNIIGIPTGDTATVAFDATGSDADDYVITFVPEPKAWTMMLIGCTLLTGITIRRARGNRI